MASSTPPPTNFYPRPPRGGRRYKTALKLRKVEFLSTPSARRATVLFPIRTFLIFISIHALREEGDQMVNRYVAEVPISIHALREEGD